MPAGGVWPFGHAVGDVAVGDGRVVELVGDAGVVGVMQPFVPATVGHPDCAVAADGFDVEGAYVFAFGIVVVVVVPGAVAGGLPGDVVVADVPDVAVPAGACVAANAAPAPSALSTTAKVAFLAAMFIEVPPSGRAVPRYSPNAARPAMFRIAPESPQFTDG